MTGQTSTPSSQWKDAGAEDPHGTRYDVERRELSLGDLTDEQMANAVFMHGNAKLTHAEILAGALMPIVYLTGAKDRIRWLSRSLEKALAALTKMTQDRDERLNSNLALRARNELLQERLKAVADLFKDNQSIDLHPDLVEIVLKLTDTPDIAKTAE
jgi:hypothetical protein